MLTPNPLLSTSLGLQMPSTFNVASHNAVHDCLTKYLNSHELQWRSFASGWNAVAYRFRSAAEYDEEFTQLIVSNSPPPEERFRQEHALFGFFVCSLSAIECFFYSTYCFASILNDKSFPISTPKSLKFYPKDVAEKFANTFKNEPLSDKMDECLKAPIYAELSKIRNVITHRGTLPRKFFEGGQDSGKAMMPSNPDDLSNLWNYDFAIDSKTTHDRAQLIGETLSRLLAAAETFCIQNL